jgi:hypothetical protein
MLGFLIGLTDYFLWFKNRVIKTKTDRGVSRTLKANSLFVKAGMMIFFPFIKPEKPISATSAACKAGLVR